MSLVGIWLSGDFEVQPLLLAAGAHALSRFGAWAGGRLQGVFPDGRIRYAVLTVCAASAIVLLLRSLLA